MEEELTYYKFWLTRDVWNAGEAINLLADYYKLNRAWQPYEDVYNILTEYRTKIANMLNDADKSLFSKCSRELLGYGEIVPVNNECDSCEPVEFNLGKLIIEDCDVYFKVFLSWAFDNKLLLPSEFKEFIGIYDLDEITNQKVQEKNDKQTCQAVGKTIWSFSPNMTIEEMIDHKAIQIYASGRLYGRDTTLRRWLSEVDPRENKTGKKKTK